MSQFQKAPKRDNLKLNSQHNQISQITLIGVQRCNKNNVIKVTYCRVIAQKHLPGTLDYITRIAELHNGQATRINQNTVQTQVTVSN